MALPASFARTGFVVPAQARQKVRLRNGQFLKSILIGSYGESDSGKTEFSLSIPGYVQVVTLDRNFQGVLDNPHPPATRNPNVGMKIIPVPIGHPTVKEGLGRIADYGKYHTDIRDSFYGALENPDSTAVVIDGDSDWWEVHQLAHFGKTTQIYPSTRYAAPYAERRAINNKAFDSGKIIVMTNKVKDEYETVYKPDGTPEKDPVNGEDLQRRTGRKIPQGFKDRDYLFQIWLNHMYKPAAAVKIGAKTVQRPAQWGLSIAKCKHSKELEGSELWGDDCNFKGLVSLVFPDVPLERWGF
jgi:hypothetical protein